MTAIQKLSVIVPCFNEEANIPRYAIELFDPILKVVPAAEFIFVDDGSTDRTPDLLADLCRERKDARLVRHDRNLGLGLAVRTGLSHAMGDAALTLDADLTFHPGETPKLIQAYRDGVDCVAGSPYLGAMENVPIVRKILSHGVNSLYGACFGRRLTAASSIFRLYRISAVKKLSLTSQSFDINAEIAFRLIQAGGKIVEVPATLLVRTGGASKISTAREIRNHVRLLWRVLRWRFGWPS